METRSGAILNTVNRGKRSGHETEKEAAEDLHNDLLEGSQIPQETFGDDILGKSTNSTVDNTDELSEEESKKKREFTLIYPELPKGIKAKPKISKAPLVNSKAKPKVESPIPGTNWKSYLFALILAVISCALFYFSNEVGTLILAYKQQRVYQAKIEKLNTFIESSNDRFHEFSLAVVERVLSKTLRPENDLPYFLTLFGSNETDLFSMADAISEINGALLPDCKYQLDASSNREFLIHSIDKCNQTESRMSLQFRNLHQLSGQTATILHRFCNGIESLYRPAFYLATFTTSRPFTGGDKHINRFAREHFQRLFKDIDGDLSAKVINRLLKDIAMLKN